MILQQGFEPERFCAALERYRANVTWLVPTMIIGLLDDAVAACRDFSSLRTLVWSGAPMAPDRVRQAIDRFGPVLVQCYGQTEAPNTVLTLAGTDQARKPMAAGRPFPGLEVALLDEDGQPVPAGTAGEICVRGPLVMSGYWRMPDATRDAFAHGWLHTGDIGRIDADGDWHVIDRKKEMVISGGFNVFPREVEDVLTAQPGVAAACVFGVPHDKWGEAVVALVVPAPGASPVADDLIRAVRDAKGPVQAPKLIEFSASIPQTGLGKPDRKALRLAFADRMRA
ncbi:AMP-binding protein (plasmid) [Niveispirillum fermenti]